MIGITGISRSGKTWVSKGLLQAFEAMGKKATIVGQDDFWFQACQVQVRGQTRTSEEEPTCTNNEKFAAAIKECANTHDVVIAEGFQLVYHPQVTSLLSHIFLIDISKGEARRRRTQPRDGTHNPNPLKPEDFDDLLWPAHERYLKDKIAPLGSRVAQIQQSPTNPAQRDEIVQRIIHAAGLMEVSGLTGNEARGRTPEASASFSRPGTRSKAEFSQTPWPPEASQPQWPPQWPPEASQRKPAKDLVFNHLKDLPPLGQKSSGAFDAQRQQVRSPPRGPNDNAMMARHGGRAGGLGASSSAPLLNAASSIMRR